MERISSENDLSMDQQQSITNDQQVNNELTTNTVINNTNDSTSSPDSPANHTNQIVQTLIELKTNFENSTNGPLKRSGQSSSNEERVLVLEWITKNKLINIFDSYTMSLQLEKISNSKETKLIEDTDELIRNLTSLHLKFNNNAIKRLKPNHKTSKVVSDLSLNLRDNLLKQLATNKTILISNHAYNKDDKMKLVHENSSISFELIKLPIYEDNSRDLKGGVDEEEADEDYNEIGELRKSIEILDLKIDKIDIYKTKTTVVRKFKLADLTNRHFDLPFFCGGIQWSINVAKQSCEEKDGLSVDYVGCYLSVENIRDFTNWSFKVKFGLKILAKSTGLP